MIKRFLLILMASVAALYGSAQDKPAQLKKYFDNLVKARAFNGGILVAENGKVVFQQVAGKANFESQRPITAQSVFPIASISKLFTATAILQLVQSGKLAVGDPVTKFLPDFPYPAIRLQDLLSHTSGLPPYNASFDSLRKASPGKVFTNSDYLNGVRTKTAVLRYQPGSSGNYDNVNFVVLALIVEKVSGEHYADYIQKHVLLPAGMTHTYFMPAYQQYVDRPARELAEPYLRPYRHLDSLTRAATIPYIHDYWSEYRFSGFGDYVSTMGDLFKFATAYDRNLLIGPQVQQSAYTPIKLSNGRANPANFGLGWEVMSDTTMGKIVYHGGNATGLSCVLLRNISKGQVVIVFDNTHDYTQGVGMDMMKMLSNRSVPLSKRSLADIYTQVLLSKGALAAQDTLYRLKKDTASYTLSEDEMNSIGYSLMGGPNNPNPYHFADARRYTEAAEVLRFNTVLFPQSWNSWDSYGEALVFLGQNEAAIASYRRSLELNPNNDGGRKALAALNQIK